MPPTLGQLIRPVQFERWCILYLDAALQRVASLPAKERRRWARDRTQAIMRRLPAKFCPPVED